MSDEGLQQARDKMATEGVDPVAIEVFAHYYRLVESGETGMVPEDTIDPLDMEALADVDVPDDVAREAIGRTVVIKLNGGLGTSMGMDRAKSLLEVRDAGRGIPEADRVRVFDRFQRLAADRGTPGTGLGLALVRAIVQRHGGSIELLDNQPGLRVRITLPRVSPAVD